MYQQITPLNNLSEITATFRQHINASESICTLEVGNIQKVSQLNRINGFYLQKNLNVILDHINKMCLQNHEFYKMPQWVRSTNQTVCICHHRMQTMYKCTENVVPVCLGTCFRWRTGYSPQVMILDDIFSYLTFLFNKQFAMSASNCC